RSSLGTTIYHINAQKPSFSIGQSERQAHEEQKRLTINILTSNLASASHHTPANSRSGRQQEGNK
ncbi:hypothetical protein ILYODFUR_018216, partial [Ilyodon furcidens]